MKKESLGLIKLGDDFSWDTIGGKRFEGVVVGIDSNVLFIRCKDGIIRPVEV